jgi:hypothetical protein
MTQNKKDILLIGILATILVFYTEKYLPNVNTDGRYYDCSLAEISPDYPIKVKEECRKLQINHQAKLNLPTINYIL